LLFLLAVLNEAINNVAYTSEHSSSPKHRALEQRIFNSNNHKHNYIMQMNEISGIVKSSLATSTPSLTYHPHNFNIAPQFVEGKSENRGKPLSKGLNQAIIEQENSNVRSYTSLISCN